MRPWGVSPRPLSARGSLVGAGGGSERGEIVCIVCSCGLEGSEMSADSTLETILISVLKEVCLRCDFVHAEAFKPAGNTMMVQVT